MLPWERAARDRAVVPLVFDGDVLAAGRNFFAVVLPLRTENEAVADEDIGVVLQVCCFY